MSGANACLQLGVDHGVAAVLDHDGRAVEALQPGQRLDQDRRPSRRPAQPGSSTGVGRSRRVGRVLVHVGVRQVGGPDRRGPSPSRRSTVTVTSRPDRSTLLRSPAAAPPWQTQHPVDRHVDPVGLERGVGVPTAARIRPQFGSLPNSAVLTRLLPGTPRPTCTASASLAAPLHLDGDVLGGALGVGQQLLGQVVADRGDRRGQLLGVGCRSEAPLASSSTVSLVDMQPSASIRSKVTRTAARSAASRAVVVGDGVGGDHDEHGGHRRGEHARALGDPADRPAAASASAACLATVSVVMIAVAAAARPRRRRPAPRRPRVDAGQQLAHRQQLADQAGGADRDVDRRRDARSTLGGVLGGGVGVAEALRAGAGVGAAGVEHDRAEPPAAEHLLAPQHRRGLDPVAGEDAGRGVVAARR